MQLFVWLGLNANVYRLKSVNVHVAYVGNIKNRISEKRTKNQYLKVKHIIEIISKLKEKYGN